LLGYALIALIRQRSVVHVHFRPTLLARGFAQSMAHRSALGL
jgi:hypothetical protein